MDMGSLPRSEISFRRSGSSGLVWDDKALSGELTKISTKSEEDKASSATMKRSRSNGGGKERAYRAANVEPAADPPSPKISGCCASVFGKPAQSTQQPPQKSGNLRRK